MDGENSVVKMICGNSEERILVDSKHAKRLCNIRWHLNNRHVKEARGFQMSRIILGEYGKEDVHHLNGNPLDNREANLMSITRKLHTHGHKKKKNSGGVEKRGNYYRAKTAIKRKVIHVTFEKEQQACRFVDWINRVIFGEQASMNSPKHICSALAAYMIMQSTEEFTVLFERRNGHELRAMHGKYEKMDEESMGKLLRNQLLPVTLSASEGVNPNDSTLGCIPIENIRQLKIAGNVYRVSEI